MLKDVGACHFSDALCRPTRDRAFLDNDRARPSISGEVLDGTVQCGHVGRLPGANPKPFRGRVDTEKDDVGLGYAAARISREKEVRPVFGPVLLVISHAPSRDRVSCRSFSCERAISRDSNDVLQAGLIDR